MKKITLFLFALFTCWQINAQSIVIGTATSTTTSTGSDPIDGYFESFRYQVVYTAAELSASMTPYDEITALGFSIAGDYGGGNLQGYTIKMGHTSASNCAAHINSPTIVVKNPFNYNPTVTAEGVFDMITFDTNFVWNGVDNVLVEICSDGPNPYTSPYGQVRANTSITDGSRYVRADGATSCGVTTTATNGNKPNIQFNYIEGTPPSCLPPSALIANSISSSSAVLGWNENGTATVWNIQYGVSGFALGSGVIISGVTNTYPLTGLSSNTQYQYYVQADCGGSQSTWSGPFTFRTLCTPFSVPFSEGFNSTSTTKSCWTVLNVNADADAWNLNYATNPFEGDQVANMYTDVNGGANDDWLISPTITLTGNQRLKFHYRVQSAGEPNDFELLLSTTGTAPASFTNTLIANTSYSNITYVEQVVNLSAYSGDVNIAWHIPNGGLDGWRLYIDNVIIEDIPSCVEPNTIIASNVTSSTVDLSWTDGSGGLQFDYEYVIQAPGTGVPTASGAQVGDVTVIGEGFDINGDPLTSNTLYEVYVRANCDGLDFSPWVGPITFRTLCNAITTLPHSESFDAATNPSCWSTALISGSTNWAPTTNNDGVPAPRTGTHFAGKSWLGDDNALLISPPYDLSAYATDQARLNVWIYRSANGLATDRVTFYANTANNLTGATMLVDVPLPITSAPTVASAGWYNYTVDVPLSYNAGGVFYIIAQGRTSSSWSSYSVGFDDYVLELVPSVPNCSTVSTPANLATNVAIETNISWSANVDATGYWLRIGTTPGGSEVLVNTDLGNVLTYNPPVDFNYSTVYYVTLTPYNANGTAVGCTETSFTTRNVPPAGSICSDPIVINPLTLPYTTTDNTNLYGDDYEDGSTQCSSYYMSGDDVVYTITPPTNMSVDIVLSNLSATYSGIHVLDGCPNSTTPPACIAFAGNYDTTIRDIQDVLLTGGVTYYIVISTWAAPQSTAYTLTITQNTCVNPTVSFSATSNCPTTNFNAVANITNLGSATSLTVSDNQGSTPQVVTATGNVSFGPFAFGTNVVLTVVNDQDTSCSVTSSNLTTAACPPANDECANAIAISSMPYSNTQDASAATGPVVSTCTGMNDGVWYTVVGNGADIIIDVTAVTGWDPELGIYTGSCGTFTCVDSIDDEGTSVGETYTIVASTLGTTYYINVGHYSGSGDSPEGPFTIDVTTTLSSDSFDNANFTAYPNPVKDVLNVSYSSEISSIRVINMIGQEVISKNINATSTQVDMSQLSAGTYIVNVTVGDNVKTLKVVKQ